MPSAMDRVSSGLTSVAASPATSSSAEPREQTTGRPGRHGLDDGQAEALLQRRQHERRRRGHEGADLARLQVADGADLRAHGVPPCAHSEPGPTSTQRRHAPAARRPGPCRPWRGSRGSCRLSSLPTYSSAPRGRRWRASTASTASARDRASRYAGSIPLGMTAILAAGTSRSRRASEAVCSETQMTPSARARGRGRAARSRAGSPPPSCPGSSGRTGRGW